MQTDPTEAARARNVRGEIEKAARLYLRPLARQVEGWVSRTVYLEALVRSSHRTDEREAGARAEVSTMFSAALAAQDELNTGGTAFSDTASMRGMNASLDQLRHRLEVF